jgi:hypothetical protein
LKSSPNPSKRGELETDIANEIVNEIAIDIENILEPIACVFFNPFSRYPSASALKKGRMLPPIGAILKSFGFFLTFGFELHRSYQKHRKRPDKFPVRKWPVLLTPALLVMTFTSI